MSDPYASDEWKAFVRRIAATPGDDVTRLVAADWIEEHGDAARAELIMVQCQLAEKPGHNHGNHITGMRRVDCPLCSLRNRELELIGGNYGGDVMGKDDPCQNITIGVTWKRGFVATVRTDWKQWRDKGDAILEQHPVEVVTLTGMPDLQWHGRDGGIRNHCCSLVAAPRHFEYEWSRREFELFTGGRPAAERASAIVLLGRTWPFGTERPRIRFELPPERPYFQNFSAQYNPAATTETLRAAFLLAELRTRVEADARRDHPDDRVEWLTPPGGPQTMPERPLRPDYMVYHNCPSDRPSVLQAIMLPPSIHDSRQFANVAITLRRWYWNDHYGDVQTHYFYVGRCAGCSTTYLLEARERP